MLRWEPPYAGVSTPPSPEIPKKSQKALRGPPLKKCQKGVKKGVKKTAKSVFGGFFETFLTLRAGRAGKTFLRLFGDFGARECGDSCIWRFPL